MDNTNTAEASPLNRVTEVAQALRAMAATLEDKDAASILRDYADQVSNGEESHEFGQTVLDYVAANK